MVKVLNTPLRSFPPVTTPDARILILGSMPGKASLQAGQYYAHPRNAFWKIMGMLFGFDADMDYKTRLKTLRANKIALWDVMKTCVRNSSLDSDIVNSSIVPNDFRTLFDSHSDIRYLFFNGAMAETSFHKHVANELDGKLEQITCQRLPSTSPANANFTFQQKLNAWETIKKAMIENTITDNHQLEQYS